LAFSKDFASCSSVIPSTLACKSNTYRSSSLSSSTVYAGSWTELLYNYCKYYSGVKLFSLNIFKNCISSSVKSFCSLSSWGWMEPRKMLSFSSRSNESQALSSISSLSPSNLIFEGSVIPFSLSNWFIISSSPLGSSAGGGVLPSGVAGGVLISSCFGGSYLIGSWGGSAPPWGGVFYISSS